jgi:platelet-activating factor acetylhydrolase IB subunit alpha
MAASGSEDGTIKLWDHESGEYTRTLKGHTNTVRSIAFTPTGTHLASASSDLSIKLWDITTYTCIRTLRGHDHTISAIKFIPSPLAASESLEKKNGEATSTGIDSTVAGTSFLVSASRDKTIKFWDVETGFVEHTISDNNDWVRCIAVRDCDGEVMASAGNDQIISIFQTTGDRNKIATLMGHEHVIEALAFVTAPTPAEKKDKGIKSVEVNNYLASGGRDRSVRLWNIVTQQCLNVFKYHENWVRSVILHPSGNYIISAGDDRTIRIMDIKSNRCLRTLENAHPHFVTSLAMHHTLPILVSGGVDQHVNCWQLE